jgi:hypothetical protein
MRLDYNRQADPPELIVPAVVAPLDSAQVMDFDAKIDTGADMTIVPSSLRRSLNIKIISRGISRGALGEEWRSIPLFMVRIRIVGSDWMDVMVTESPKNYILLGRDILNRYVLTAHGPEGWFELELPSKLELPRKA